MRALRAACYAAAVVLAVLAASAEAATTPPLKGAVRVVFTGSGQEAYRDYREWIFQVNNRCWYDKTVENTAAFSWTTTWQSIPLSRLARTLEAAAPSIASATGTVGGQEERTDCGWTDPLPDWAGTTPCDEPLEVADGGALDIRTGRTGGIVVDVQAPSFSLFTPSQCTVNVRNSQLGASVGLKLRALTRLARGKSLTIPVGTHAPGSLIEYAPDYDCSRSEPPYEGAFIKDRCKDTLVWQGTLTITKL